MTHSEPRGGTGHPPQPAPAGRLFLAVPLDEPTRAALVQHLAAALSHEPLPGRVVAPANLHITLRFLGDTTTEAYARLVDALARTELGPRFEVRFDCLGAFPTAAQARVLWLGIQEGRQSLASLAAIVEAVVREQGWPAEDRPFAAHITLSRFKPDFDVRPLLARVPPFGKAMPVREVVLFRSHLAPTGPRYEPLRCFPLAGSA